MSNYISASPLWWPLLQNNSISFENNKSTAFVNICFVVFLASTGCISIVGATMLIEGFLLPQCCFTPTVNIVFICIIIIINAITVMDALFHVLVLFSHIFSSCMLIKFTICFKAFQGLQYGPFSLFSLVDIVKQDSMSYGELSVFLVVACDSSQPHLQPVLYYRQLKRN